MYSYLAMFNLLFLTGDAGPSPVTLDLVDRRSEVYVSLGLGNSSLTASAVTIATLLLITDFVEGRFGLLDIIWCSYR